MNEYFLYHLVATGRVALARALRREMPETKEAKDSSAELHGAPPAAPHR